MFYHPTINIEIRLGVSKAAEIKLDTIISMVKQERNITIKKWEDWIVLTGYKEWSRQSTPSESHHDDW